MSKTDPEADLPLVGDTSGTGSTPGIAYSSTTDLRGFPLSPNGTALGVGGPLPSDPPAKEPSPKAKIYPQESFDRLQKTLQRMVPSSGTSEHKSDDALEERRGEEADASPSVLTPGRRRLVAIVCLGCFLAIALVVIGRVTAPRPSEHNIGTPSASSATAGAALSVPLVPTVPPASVSADAPTEPTSARVAPPRQVPTHEPPATSSTVLPRPRSSAPPTSSKPPPDFDEMNTLHFTSKQGNTTE